MSFDYLDEVAVEVYRAADKTSDGAHALPMPERFAPLYRNMAALVVTSGDKTRLSQVHAAWCVAMGGEKPTHPFLAPFETLDYQLVSDRLGRLLDAVKLAARAMAEGTKSRDYLIDLMSGYCYTTRSEYWVGGFEDVLRLKGGVWEAISRELGGIWPLGRMGEDGWTTWDEAGK